MKSIGRLLSIAGLLTLAGTLLAQPTAHYVPGAEGLKGASLPPPGWYLRDYNIGYYSTRLNDPSGDRTGPPNFSVFTYANVPRLIWITETKFLGGYVGVDALLPLIYQNVRAGDRDSNFAIGDVFAEGTLSWHIERFDFSFGAGFWAPTGDSTAPPTPTTGEGCWTPMLTAGATWYLDKQKTWSISALNRYEFNTENDDTGITPGQAYTLEWGIGKAVTPALELGVVGYYQLQVTDDSGTGASTSRDSVAAVGPEISLAFPKSMIFVSFRYLYEFMAEDRAEGQTFSLTLTKRF